MGPHDGISALVEKEERPLPTAIGGHSKKVALQARKRTLTRNYICWHHELGLSASKDSKESTCAV